MPDREVRQPHFPTVEFVLDAIASWINKYRELNSLHNEFGRCSPEGVMQIAKDLGVPAGKIRGLSAKGPGAADLLEKMLVALGVDPRSLAKTDPDVMRDLQRLCVVCSQRGRCEHVLADGAAAGHFQEFCPNAFTLDALFKQKQQQNRH